MSLAYPSILSKTAQSAEQQANVSAYLAPCNLAVLRDKPFLAVPYPDPARLAIFLSDPDARLGLPQEIRPLKINPQDRFARTVLKGRWRPYVQSAKFWLFLWAPAIMGGGLALLFSAALLVGFNRRSIATAPDA